MYLGEVNIAHEDLDSFLAVAQDLCIKGLTQDNSTSQNDTSQHTPSGSGNTSSASKRPKFSKNGVEHQQVCVNSVTFAHYFSFCSNFKTLIYGDRFIFSWMYYQVKIWIFASQTSQIGAKRIQNFLRYKEKRRFFFSYFEHRFYFDFNIIS